MSESAPLLARMQFRDLLMMLACLFGSLSHHPMAHSTTLIWIIQVLVMMLDMFATSPPAPIIMETQDQHVTTVGVAPALTGPVTVAQPLVGLLGMGALIQLEVVTFSQSII
jgi:hypothetical protein